MRAPADRALRAVIFDFDHTLSDFGRWVEWRRARDDIGALYTEHGVDAATVLRRRGSFSLIAALHDALAARVEPPRALAVRATAFRILEDYECAGAERAGLLDGAAAAIADARRRGLALAIVSANAEQPIRRALERLDVASAFDAIIGRTADRPLKPEPDMHREALRVLGCDAETALAIGDSVNDMKAAASAGVLTIGVTGGEGSESELFATGAAYVLADLTALPTLLSWGEIAAR